MRVHLGPSPRDPQNNNTPSPFQTAGVYLNANGTPGGAAWQPKARMAIVGSGVDVTFLRLMPETGSGTNDRHYFAIGAPTTAPTHFLEVSGLTIDCNLPSSALIACGAIRVMGDHVRIRDVKCVNWGSRTSAQPGFVIAVLVADPDNNSPWLAADNAGIEQCLAVEPSRNNTVSGPVVNILHLGGRGLTAQNVSQFGRGGFIRRCMVDGTPPGAAMTVAAEFRALSMSGCQGGVAEDNHIQNTYTGGPLQTGLNAYEVIVRGNSYRNVWAGPWSEISSATRAFDHYLIEGNDIQLSPSASDPAGILVYSDTGSPVHGQVVIRNNRLRFTDGVPGSTGAPAIRVRNAEAAVVTGNLIETHLDGEDALLLETCDAVIRFDNRTPDAALTKPGEDRCASQFDGPADDALALSCLEK